MPVTSTTITAITRRSDALAGRWVPDLLRWTAGLLWLSNASWKVPPDFGRSDGSCGGLCGYMEEGVAHPVAPGSAWLFEHVLNPNLFLFGWATVLTETVIAALFISGRHLRVAAVLGLLQSVGIGLAVANADGEWYWSYGIMIALHLAVLATAATCSRPSVRTNGLVVAGYGVLVALAHRSAGLTGDENATWSLFDQRNDLPGDFGRNIAPGSILLGLVLIGLGLTAAFGADRLGDRRVRAVGAGLLAVSTAILIFVAAPRVEGWLGMRPTTIAMVMVLAFAMLSPSRAQSPGNAGPPVRG